MADIPNDQAFEEAVKLLSSKAAQGRGFFLTVFVVKDGGTACDMYAHQDASEQMIEAMLRDLLHDPRYERPIKCAIGLPFGTGSDPIGETAGSA